MSHSFEKPKSGVESPLLIPLMEDDLSDVGPILATAFTRKRCWIAPECALKPAWTHCFNGFSALKIVLDRPSVPFICVSGTIWEGRDVVLSGMGRPIVGSRCGSPALPRQFAMTEEAAIRLLEGMEPTTNP
jgi:hypothetical protein